MLRKSLIAALSIVLATGFTPSASANEHEATQGIYTQNSNANTSTDLPYFEFSNETENSVDAEVKNGTLAMTEDGSVNVLDNDGSVSYTLNVDGVTPNGTPAQYDYQIDGNQVSVNWTESASQQIMSVQGNSATESKEIVQQISMVYQQIRQIKPLASQVFWAWESRLRHL